MCKTPNPGTLLLLGAPPWVAYMAHGWRQQEHKQEHSHAAYNLGRFVRRRWYVILAIIAALIAWEIWGVGHTPTRAKADEYDRQQAELNKIMELQDARNGDIESLTRRLREDLRRIQQAPQNEEDR